MSRLVDEKLTWKVHAGRMAVRKKRFHSHLVFFLLTNITCVTMWNKYSLEPFIRNTSAMDHCFLCIGQLLCPPKANGHSFTPVNRQWPGFTCLSVTGHQRLTFVFLSVIELEWLGSTSFQSVTFSTNTAFRNGFLPILCSLCRILGRLAGLVLSHAGNDLYFTFHCSHPAWVNHSRCGCHSKPEAEPCYHSVANQHTLHEA